MTITEEQYLARFWDYRYSAAVRGASQDNINLKWAREERAEFLLGWKAAVANGLFNSHPDYK